MSRSFRLSILPLPRLSLSAGRPEPLNPRYPVFSKRRHRLFPKVVIIVRGHLVIGTLRLLLLIYWI